MQKGYDIIIPVYNEKNIIKLLDYLLLHVKNHNFIYICYDYEEDVTISIFNKSKYNKYEKIKLLKNPGIGPCEAIKNGLNKSVSDAAIVYPADDFYNAKILDEMYYYKTKGYDLVCPSRFIRGGIIKN